MNFDKNQGTETDPRWIKKTAIFLSSQSLSLFGSMLVQYAIIWHVTLTTQSGAIADHLDAGRLSAADRHLALRRGVGRPLPPQVPDHRRRYAHRGQHAGAGDILPVGLPRAVADLPGLRHPLGRRGHPGASGQRAAAADRARRNTLMQGQQHQQHHPAIHHDRSRRCWRGAALLSRLEAIFFIDVVTAALAVGLLLALEGARRTSGLQAPRLPATWMICGPGWPISARTGRSRPCSSFLPSSSSW